MKSKPTSLLATAILSLTGLTAKADVWWQWSFDGESGLFLTDGDIGDAVVDHRFAVKDFAVTGSNAGSELGTLSENKYQISQPYIGFEWSGTGVTQFFRDSGNHTNGATIGSRENMEVGYGFAPNQGGNAANSRLWYVGDYDAEPIATAPLLLIPILPDVVARPDMLIGKTASSASQFGENLYNGTGAGQQLKLRTRDRKAVKFYCSVNSDADVPEGFRIRTKGKNRLFKVKHLFWDGSGWKNITGAAIGRGYTTPRYLPGESTPMQVRVKPKTRGRKSKRTIRCQATSRADDSTSDLIKAKITVKP